MHKGRLLQNFQKEVQQFIAENKDNENISSFQLDVNGTVRATGQVQFTNNSLFKAIFTNSTESNVHNKIFTFYIPT